MVQFASTGDRRFSTRPATPTCTTATWTTHYEPNGRRFTAPAPTACSTPAAEPRMTAEQMGLAYATDSDLRTLSPATSGTAAASTTTMTGEQLLRRRPRLREYGRAGHGQLHDGQEPSSAVAWRHDDERLPRHLGPYLNAARIMVEDVIRRQTPRATGRSRGLLGRAAAVGGYAWCRGLLITWLHGTTVRRLPGGRDDLRATHSGSRVTSSARRRGLPSCCVDTFNEVTRPGGSAWASRRDGDRIRASGDEASTSRR